MTTPTTTPRRRFAVAGMALLTASVLAVGVAASASPRAETELRTLGNYAATVPFALHAPTWVPDGYALVDGDGPWTTFAGEPDIHRAEIMFAPARLDGPPPLMIAQMDHTRLPAVTRALPEVQLAEGVAHHFQGEVWSALYWEVGDLTMAIEYRLLDVADVARVASSMRPVATG